MKITPFEKACNKLGINPTLLPGVEGLPEVTAKQIIAGYKLGIIADATGKRVDFTTSTIKYTGWIQWVPSLRRFVCADTDYTYTYTDLGARFWFSDRDTATKFTQENIDLINDLHL
ncbi:hypothetical protein [uncultured Mucilaginibacter sp.]|uniref:hypothetical protein n=1 Tax=uncultured Mucilaginibacter sp. TaxID=797541 RepID=UPI0025E0B942|nr:hypothetical protein [uncultured Mucilaginibacter sp.]